MSGNHRVTIRTEAPGSGEVARARQHLIYLHLDLDDALKLHLKIFHSIGI